MKIFGIGTDIVNIKRMEKSLKRRGNSFKNKIFNSLKNHQFNQLALELFEFQMQKNTFYTKYAKYILGNKKI